MMKQTRLLAFLLALLLLSSSLFGCAAKTPEPVAEEPTDQQTDPQPDKPAEPEIEVVYELTVRNDDIHTEMQNEYLRSKKPKERIEGMDGNSGENSRPQAIVLKWTTTKVVGGKLDRVETAVISEDKDFSDPIRMETETRRVELVNMEIGKTLYWYVEGKVSGKVVKSDVATVTVVDNGPRNLDVDGVTNCRDLGGWKDGNGVMLNQGVLIRSANFNKVTSAGKKVLLDDLGIKTEIELRMEKQAPSTTESKLGSSVNFVFAPMDDTASNLLSSDVNAKSLLKVFETLGDESNYPIIFHCNIGTDRTGMISFLVLGLCGVAEKDLYRDYMFSNFATLGSARGSGAIEKYINTVKSSEGETLAEKIENYLLSRGVTAEQIATVKKMMKPQ